MKWFTNLSNIDFCCTVLIFCVKWNLKNLNTSQALSNKIFVKLPKFVKSRWGKAIVSENVDVLRNMLIQFHATLAASCNLRDIKDINGIAFFAYFDGTFNGESNFSSRFVYNLCSQCANLWVTFRSQPSCAINRGLLNCCCCLFKLKVFIVFQTVVSQKLNYDPICVSVDWPRALQCHHRGLWRYRNLLSRARLYA